MRWIGVVALVAGVLVPSAPASAASSCSASGSRTVFENGVARVYEDRDYNTFVCSKVNGTRRMIAFDPEDVAELIVLRGHFVAYGWESCEPPGPEAGCARRLYVRDVRREEPVFASGGEPDWIVLRSNGSVAWSETMLDDADRDVGLIYRHTRRGTTRLDRGRRVDPGSLRLTGRKLSWLNGGERRRATLR
jgi:hypothetical protein